MRRMHNQNPVSISPETNDIALTCEMLQFTDTKTWRMENDLRLMPDVYPGAVSDLHLLRIIGTHFAYFLVIKFTPPSFFLFFFFL